MSRPKPPLGYIGYAPLPLKLRQRASVWLFLLPCPQARAWAVSLLPMLSVASEGDSSLHIHCGFLSEAPVHPAPWAGKHGY